ncbi:hypothetical protein K503DRAFT_856137 [Rhizopogon vinicolor AM-OR11-026]|uniref:F-box domain-containing protein n=1 Tax=Rhizopogon vinicolor AM-OR11-026 TaxID=1314800 RepID=A0A1B7N317_9AGAM|nr:hypothetical protein K503DRAFT_856137 [Rhizopogon vinicolor AM-OR11-026]
MDLPCRRMHRLFLIQELIALICEHVQNDNINVGARGKTLASLARTSKNFHDVAINALWSNLNGLAPLLNMLASDLTYTPQASLPGWMHPRTLVLPRPLKKAEWDKLRSRARRVKHLRVTDPSQPVHVSVIRTLSNPPTTSPLFPNLRSIFWNDDRPETFSFIRMLSGPRVTSVSINIEIHPTGNSIDNRWDTTELSILTSLPYICPNVTQVSLPTNTFVNGVPFISEVLCAWSKLKDINCGALDATALVHLAEQPTLRKLAFTLPNSRAWLDSLPSWAFSSVRDFQIQAANLSSLVAFIDRIGGSPASMQMQLSSNPPPGTVSSIFTALGRFQLQDVSLRLDNRSHPPGPVVVTPNAPTPFPFPYLVHPNLIHPGHPLAPYYHPQMFGIPPQAIANGAHIVPQPTATHLPSSSTFHTLTSRDLAPLTFFDSLGRIDINVDYAISLNDDDLKSLVTSWPHLYYFSLNNVSGWRIKSGVTHIGLLAMLELCPDLQTLYIALNTDAFREVPSDRPGEGVENRSLQTLGLIDSTVDSGKTVVVAAFLSDIFPNLTDIAAWDSATMSQRPNAVVYSERWKHVCEIVQGIKKVRQQERRWQQLDEGQRLGHSEGLYLQN